MNSETNGVRLRSALVVLFALVAGMLAGCDKGHKMYQVSGKVLYKDGSVPKAPIAQVQLMPTRDSTAEVKKGAVGDINSSDGSFSLSTRKPGDGVLPGDYNVVFSLCKGAMDTKQLIEAKYNNPNLTPYKLTVDGDKKDLTYEIEPLGAGGAAENAPK
jgi:hypothetical protein